jgi:hypothetical protein
MSRREVPMIVRPQILLLIVSACVAYPARADDAMAKVPPSREGASVPSVTWPVATSLKSTLSAWAARQEWPAPQFLTDADWTVDVPGSLPGSIEEALKLLAAGFGRSPTRPRIEITANHVIVVSEVGAE